MRDEPAGAQKGSKPPRANGRQYGFQLCHVGFVALLFDLKSMVEYTGLL